ncbi:MAG: hypothetical protein AABZ15_06240 [Nitrospirota bacterium]
MKALMKSIAAIVIIALPAYAVADYIGPEEIASWKWGTAEDQIGPGRDQCDIDYHPLLAVMPDGSIYINDIGNTALKIYTNGVLQKKSKSNCDTLRVMGVQGLEEGRGEVTYKRLSEYSTEIKAVFKDKNYQSGTFYRDKSGNIYTVARREVRRYNKEGYYVGNLLTATDDHTVYYAVIEPGGKRSGPYSYAEQAIGIRNLVIGPDGNIYCEKRSHDGFHLLKWTWREAQELYGLPDTPRYVEASSSPNGIIIRWWGVLQGNESITAYEFLRSKKSGTSSYTSLGILQRKDIAGFASFEDKTAEKGITYYYRMRSISGDKYSVYSNEAIGRR